MPKPSVDVLQFKEKLRAELKSLSEDNNLGNAPHPFLAQGAQSIVLHDGPEHILLITPIDAAKGIECLRQTFKTENESYSLGFHIPTLIGLDMNINILMNSEDLKEGKQLKLSTDKQNLWQENVVYRLPKYKNNLEEFKRHKFDPVHIEQIETAITHALMTLHARNLSHNDIALRNIFYTGSYPNFNFYLGDFGSVTLTQHVKKTDSTPTKDQDFYNLEKLVLSKLRMIKRTPTPQQKSLFKREEGKRRVKSVKPLLFSPVKPVKKQDNKNKVSKKNTAESLDFCDLKPNSPIATRKRINKH